MSFLMHRCFLFMCIICTHVSRCEVLTFNLTHGTKPVKGSSVSLVCSLSKFTYAVHIYKVDHENAMDTDDSLISCSHTSCQKHNDYDAQSNGNVIEITIHQLQREKDQKWWRCKTALTNESSSIKQFFLQVITEPSGIHLQPYSPCDLASDDCTIACITNSCTYPEPTMQWFYTMDNGQTMNDTFGNFIQSDQSLGSCSDSESNFSSSITFPRYTTFPHNVPMTIRLRCKLMLLDMLNITSDLSSTIQFAVAVQSVSIQPEKDPYITVSENISQTVNCITSASRPQATVMWHKSKGQSAEPLPTSNFTTRSMDKDLYVTHSFLYLRAERKDIGWNVTCTASNGITKSVSAISKYINVLYSANITDFDADSTGVTVSKNNITISEGDSLTLRCEVDSNPNGTIEIWRKGVPVNTTKGVSILTFGLTNATCMDTCQLVCKAWNDVGSSNPEGKQLQLYVKCSPRLANETNPVVTARLWLSAVLSLSVIAFPPPNVIWSRNISGVWESLPGIPDFITTRNESHYSLIISNVTNDVFGEYRIQLENGVSEGFSFIFVLQFRGEPDSPYAVAVIVTSASSAIVEWSPGYNGNFEQIFYIQYRKIGAKVWRTISVNAPNRLKRISYTIEDLQPANDYELIVFASNDYGNSTASEIFPFSTNGEGANTGSVVGIIGGVIGGIVAAGLILVSAIFIYRRYPLRKANQDNKGEEKCYENPVILLQEDQVKTQVKSSKPAQAKMTQKPPQSGSRDGLTYVELSFVDQGKNKKDKKRQKGSKPRPAEGIVYDDIQFGVVGGAYPSSEEDNIKN